MNMTTVFVEGDPYLAYQPDFSKSLPVQLFVNGITITLLIVLLFHLLFTTQYHYPLAPLNYCLQLISILVVVISVVVKTWATLAASADNASYWPYDLDYIAVDIPPSSWNTGEKAAWWLLQALNNAFVNITHIQFLTLLYPSRTEARLIIFILGPLAIASSGLVFTALSGSQRVLDITDSIRNILDSTLLLIFTIALCLWGFLVNRRRAWRTDGGTAVFGTGSLLLAIVSTSGNFVAVAEEGIEWLQHLLFAAIVWQTWLGWWWWVGSGMGIGEVEDLMERAEKKKRKAARRAARLRAQNATALNASPRNGLRRHASVAGIVDAGQASANAMAGFTSSVTSILRNRSGTLSRRQRTTSTAGDVEHGETVEMDVLRNAAKATSADGQGSAENGQVPSSPSRVGFSEPHVPESGPRDTSNSETSSTSATPSLHPPQSLGQLLSFPTTWLQIYIRKLAKAHQEAARKQVLQRADIRSQVFDPHRNSTDAPAGAKSPIRVGDDDGLGWGLGKFGIKEHQDGARRLQEARERLREERLLPTTTEEPEAGPSRSRRPADVEEGEGESGGEAGPSDASAPKDAPEGAARGEGGEKEEDWEDVDGTSSSSSGPGKGKKDKKRKGKQKADEGTGGGPPGGAGGAGGTGGVGGTGGAVGSGWSWWGPLKQWRLSDRSTF